MINAFKDIGYSILKKDEFFQTENIIEKRKKLLFHQSLVPFEKKDKKGNKILNGRAICLNFDLDNKEIEFKLSDKELIEENREYFFAFRLAAPKDKKKFLSTNNLDTFYSSLFKESIEYIQDKRTNNKSKEWFEENITDDYKEFLLSIFNEFYIKGEFLVQKGNKKIEDSYLNYELLKENQKELFISIKNEIEEDNKKITINELYNRFLNKFFFDSYSKNISNFPSRFIVLFNNQNILEHDEGKFKNDYINLCYFDLLKRFSVEKGKKDKICHICKKENKVIQDLPLSMKFYGTTNSLNFEQVSSSNAYKSFAVCEDCLFQILTGMKYIENKFSEYLFGLKTYLIPIESKENNFNPKLYKGITRVLECKTKYKNEIEQINHTLQRANRKNLNFDLMFFFHPAGSQQFDILKLISNIEMNKLIIKLEMFDYMTKIYKLSEIGNGINALTLNNLRYYLFPSFLSHKNPDYNVYSKDLLNFLESFLTDNKIHYFSLIQKFIAIFKKRLNQNKLDELSAFKMNLFITIFSKLKLIKQGGSMDTGKSISEILKKEYQEFFVVHSDVYGNNAFKQGLFLLGTVISKIVYAQQKKALSKGKPKKLLSTFLSKINYDGIAARRIDKLVNEVKNYTILYQEYIYEEKSIWGNLTDRLQGIEKSGMKPDEVVFYILSGISFEDYMGMKRGFEKKLNENKNEGEKK